MRRPLARFLLIGALIFALDRWLFDAGNELAPDVIEISADQVAEIRRRALSESGRLPDEAVLRTLIDAEVAEEMLFREALALGLARRDEIVRRRLVQNMRFLDPEDEREDRPLYEEALALGMERSDLVVRRRLIQRMRLAIEASARSDEPSEGELEAYLARHPERFSLPPRVRFAHVLVDPARRGDASHREAERLLQRLRASPDGGQVATRLGDPSLVPRDDALRSEREIAKLFGPEFAARVLQLRPGRWEGPIASVQGLHLVWVHEREPGGPAPLASVRSEVRYAWLAEREDAALRSAVQELRRRYRVRIAP